MPFFTRERFGRPQVYAVLLLLAFAAQCVWLMAHVPLSQLERAYVEAGEQQWRGQRMAGDVDRSPLVPLIAGFPAAALSHFTADPSAWWVRLPFLAMGVLLGASLWYVARRLYGNAGGYIALGLYVFSPVMITRSATVRPEIAGAWGAFGAIFTAIAVSHTLYAPREVVLWNWRRILLLGVALGFAVGAQFSLIVIVLLGLGFMIYLVPGRRAAAVTILGAACAVALVVIWASYSLHAPALAEHLGRARFLEFAPQAFVLKVTWELLLLFFFRVGGAGTLLLFLTALVTYIAWKRTRFFGTAAPLITALTLIVLAMGMPHLGGYAFLVVMLPFAFVFISGVFADLLETQASGLALGVVVGILLAHAIFSIRGLLALPRS